MVARSRVRAAAAAHLARLAPRLRAFEAMLATADAATAEAAWDEYRSLAAAIDRPDAGGAEATVGDDGQAGGAPAGGGDGEGEQAPPQRAQEGEDLLSAG